MVLTASTMLKLGTQAPDFALPEVTSGKIVKLQDLKGSKALLVMFICRHCPYVQHIKAELTRLGKDYQAKGMTIVAISSNDAEKYPDDSAESLKAFAKEEGFAFSLLYDETQSAAKNYTAACTPDFFLFNSDQKLFYRGQLDDSRPGNGKPVTGADLRGAMDAVLEGKPFLKDQRPSIGCNIKWKPGQEPVYFQNK